MYVEYNPNPQNSRVGDCVVRAVSKLLGLTWDEAYLKLVTEGFFLKDMPSANRVWGELLREHCYRKIVVPDTCPNCYTVKDFCEDHPEGKYMVATGSHVIAVEDGNYYDSWDSGNEIPAYYWRHNGL